MQPARANSKVWILGVAALCLWCAGCRKESEEKPEVTVQAAPVQKSDISRIVNAEAVVFPVAQSAVTPKINAPVKRFLITRGQKVHKGQLLAQLENRDLSAAAMDNQGAYDQAQAAYETSIGATLPQDIQKAELDVQTAQQELDAQQKLYSSREDLFKQGALPRKELDQAGVTLAQARSQYNVAKKRLDGLNAIGKEQTLKAAKGQLSSAKGKLMGAEALLSYSEIRSPIDGYVTDRPLYPGEMASTITPLLTVMDISSVIIKAHVPQSDAMLLRKGDKAEIDVAGLESKLNGMLTLVSPALDPNSTTVEIWVQTANPNQQLRPGMSVQLSITAQTVHDALVVPASALLNATGRDAQVMVVNEKSEGQLRDVKTGIQTHEQVQIVSGLKPGEVVVSEGSYGLPDKTKLKVEKPSAAAGEGGPGKDEKGKDGDEKDR
jgi:multidrug efflux pump subunit AcrA (membrane-fusion protein)